MRPQLYLLYACLVRNAPANNCSPAWDAPAVVVAFLYLWECSRLRSSL